MDGRGREHQLLREKFYGSPTLSQLGWTILTAPIIIVGEEVLEFPEDVRAALLEGGHKAAVWEQDHYASVDKGRLEDLQKAGVTIRRLDTGPFHEAAQKVYEEFLTTEDEKKILAAIQATE